MRATEHRLRTVRRFSVGRAVVTMDLGEIAVACAIASLVGWYLWEAIAAQRSTQNLIMILPLSVLALALLSMVIAKAVRIREPGEVEGMRPLRAPVGLRIPLLMGFFGLFILVLPVLGFDVATAFFCLVCLLAQGERSLFKAAVFAVAAGAVIGVVVRFGLSPSAPMLLLPGGPG